ncbi:nucleotidyltransferase family protein [Longimicrobium sp.]|uniref:nucleotidyltransferase family protein n=1 Tax=Longimicrobium sp. TaxID=2029185 RepID=UPI002BEC9242|nr:nucleotidyltransferase family protein [Longimicrobium sp.]HSU17281.1 nucleotidyltransferase family protein [Longimicrobium sp.]
MIAGIVLAAGRSRRMGQPKAFLRLGGATFLERTVAALREGGCGEIVVVTGPPDEAPAAETAVAAERLGARVAVNPHTGSEQVDSLRAGLRALGEGIAAAAVVPVDVPGIAAATVRAVIDAFEGDPHPPIVQPCDGERHGHPVLFARALWPELMADPLPDGARTVIHAHAAQRAEVRVPHLAADVDTPEDYRRLLEMEG